MLLNGQGVQYSAPERRLEAVDGLIGGVNQKVAVALELA